MIPKGANCAMNIAVWFVFEQIDLRMTEIEKKGFHWVDYIVFLLVLAISLGIGLYHAFTGGESLMFKWTVSILYIYLYMRYLIYQSITM